MPANGTDVNVLFMSELYREEKDVVDLYHLKEMLDDET